jgi:type IV secretory pathway VirB2 component (pilin)
MLKNLFKAAHSLDVPQRMMVTRDAAWLAGGTVALIVALAVAAALNVVSADSPYWDAVLQTRLALVRLPLALAVAIIGYYLAMLLYLIFAKTYLGRRLTFIEDGDGSQIGGMKLGNAGTIQAMLFLACIAGLLLAVLR